jgi:hypothetical protein
VKRKIKVFGHPYTLYCNDGVSEEAERLGLFEAKVMGWHSGADGIIKVDNSFGLTRTKEVLLHELLEAINDQFELNLPHSSIQTIAAGYQQLLSDNKVLRELLLEEPEELK